MKHKWSKHHLPHPSGEELYVSVRDDGERVRLVANNATFRVIEMNTRRNQVEPRGDYSQVVVEWGQDRPWGDQDEEES
jgi:hypothetical protein